MMRKSIAVGDAPICGVRVLPYDGYPSFLIHGHAVALIGGRVYCDGCHSVGIIAKAGGSRRTKFISELALEGDVVMCHCPIPQPLVSSLQNTQTHWDGSDSSVEATSEVLMALPVLSGQSEVSAAKKLIDENVKHPPEAEQSENICPNMTNKQFGSLAMELRDRAVGFIKTRLEDLRRWDRDAQARVRTWFGVADENTRQYLVAGFTACNRVLTALTPANFVRYSAEAMSDDTVYHMRRSLEQLASKPALALKNADSLVGYAIFD